MAAQAMQLTLDGREEAHVNVVRQARAAVLSDAQRAILHEARHVRSGLITPTQAGIIVHRCRDGDRHRLTIASSAATRWGEVGAHGGMACCPWAASDGGAAIKRLVARGLLEEISRGLYAVKGEPE